MKAVVVNPLGIVRNSKDQGDTGHSGIDIPLRKNAPHFAVSEGEVVSIFDTKDSWGGVGLSLLIRQDGNGEGLAFIYITYTT